MNVDELRHALREEAARQPTSDGDRTAAIIERAHRAERRRRRSLALAVVAGVIIAASAVAVIRRSPESDRVVATSPSGRLSLAVLSTVAVDAAAGLYKSEVRLVDPTSGRGHTRPVPANNYGEYPVQLLQVGNRLLLPGGEGVVAAPLDLSSQPEAFASALVFVPAIEPDHIWTLSNTGPPTVTEIDATGRTTRGPIAVPPDATWPIAGTNEGVLFRERSDEVILWNPTTEVVVRRIPGVQSFLGNGWAAESTFAWAGTCTGAPVCEDLHILDLSTGQERTIAAPPDTTGFAPDGALSPDGKILAVMSASADLGQQLELIDTATGRIRTVARSNGAGSGVVWSPDGTTVYFGQDDSTTVSRYRLVDATSHRIVQGLPKFTAIAVVTT